ncbi:MAG: MFS transporter, partial [Synergistaceae bacterium]|nr:MFS transporter [Synergistaceae bacterium]
TAALIVLFLLLFSESAAALAPWVASRGRAVEGVPELVRPIIFIAYFTVSTDIAFISPLAARVFAASGSFFPISGELSSALPLSINLVCCCLCASGVGAKLVEWLGARRTLNGGILMESMGRLLCFWGIARGDYDLLIAGLGITGAGRGTVTIACHSVILSFDEERRSSLFANFNAGILSGVIVGVSIGSYVAKFFGQPAVFVFSAAAMFFVLLFGFRCISAEPAAANASRKEEREPAPDVSTGRFWSDKGIITFFSFSMFPFLVILYFKDYIFPLYADALGYSEVTVGQALLFSGAMGIWGGPPATEYIQNRLGGKYANVAANALFIAGLAVFAVAPSFETAVFTTCVTTAVSGFGLTTQNVYFMSLEPTLAYGRNGAIGAFNVADNLFQTAGPLLFGMLLPLGFQGACATVAVVGTVFLVLFLLLNRTARQ